MKNRKMLKYLYLVLGLLLLWGFTHFLIVGGMDIILGMIPFIIAFLCIIGSVALIVMLSTGKLRDLNRKRITVMLSSYGIAIVIMFIKGMVGPVSATDQGGIMLFYMSLVILPVLGILLFVALVVSIVLELIIKFQLVPLADSIICLTTRLS